jgi:SAM-dependent methyltransferase
MMRNNTDDELASRYGAYASFHSETSPVSVDYYGEEPAKEIKRLLNIYLRANSRVLDLGCGAGQTVAQIAGKAAEVWGFDQDPVLLNRSRERVQELGLTNVTLVEGNVVMPADVAQLPDDHFDVIFTERGPNMNEWLITKLKLGGFFLQELVAGYHGFHLQEILGRRPYTTYAYRDYQSSLLANMAELDLLPVSVKEYFYEEFYRDINHLAAYLTQVEVALSNWRLEPKPYQPERDRPALELYARYNTTAKGIRLLGHRLSFVWRHSPVHYYPVDGFSETNYDA